MSRVVWDQAALRSKLEVVEKKLVAVGLTLEGDIKKSMTTGTGRTYMKGKNKNIIHIASALGQPPAVDTGRLRASISTNWSGSGMANGKVGNQALAADGIDQPERTEDKFTVRVGSRVQYACILDAHTSVMTKEGSKCISCVIPGDMVLTQTGEYHSVLEVIKRDALEVPNMVTVEFEWRKGTRIHKITTTEDHKILVFREGRNKWIKVGELQETDLLFSRKKIGRNKDVSKYPDIQCLNCGTTVTYKKGNVRKRIFCSVRCRADYWTKTGTNPHINMKRSLAARAKMSVSGIKRAKEKPETHANHIMSQKGYVTSAEKQVYDWLVNRKLKRKILKQYPVAGKFVDFYIPSLNTIYEADGAYWHKDQGKDIKRDKEILSVMPNVVIKHIHFFEERFSPKDMVSNPLPGVYYSACNPGPDSFVDLSLFETKKIIGIKKWTYGTGPLTKKASWHASVYDLSVDKVHSYYANGVLVSNSWLEFGTRRMSAHPFIRPALDRLKVRIAGMLTRTIESDRG